MTDQRWIVRAIAAGAALAITTTQVVYVIGLPTERAWLLHRAAARAAVVAKAAEDRGRSVNAGKEANS